MATKKSAKKAAAAKKKRTAKWAKNAKEYAKKQKAKWANGKAPKPNAEDGHLGRAKRIRDKGQKPPKGYMRTGGLYFAKIANVRPIKSRTTRQQRGLFYDNKDRMLGADGKGGYVGSAANQGMYDGSNGDMNFRKTQGARQLIDADGGTYSPEYYNHFGPGGKKEHAVKGGKKKYNKSRFIMALGQDGHQR